jgi:hypothetical protein
MPIGLIEIVPLTFSSSRLLVTFLLPAVFSHINCPYNRTLIESLRSWAGTLSGDDYFALTVNTASLTSYSLFIASEEISVQRYTRLGERLEIAENATTPQVSPFDRVFAPSVYVYRAANKAADFSITFRDIFRHRCNRLIADNANPQMVELTHGHVRNSTTPNYTTTCLVTVVPNASVSLDIGERCQVCAAVAVYVAWDKTNTNPFAEANSTGPITPPVDGSFGPVLVVISAFAGPDEGLINVTGNIISPAGPTSATPGSNGPRKGCCSRPRPPLPAGRPGMSTYSLESASSRSRSRS